MDVSRDSIAVGTLRPAEEVPEVTKVFNDEPSVRRFVGAFDDPRRLVACYEAGPTGCRPPAAWDHLTVCFASIMGPPFRQ
ncbi:MAG: hypothetical protein ACRDHY_02235 [Anaerolineales bacterium]